LEEGFELLLVNAKHVKNVPGRKTDVKDAEWLAELLAHGLVRASFVPPEPIQQLRELTRTRKQFVQDRSSNIQRLQKILEDANIKIDCVISDILGKSGRAMLEAIAAGETDPEKLARLAHPRLKATPDNLKAALRGRINDHHRLMLRIFLDQIDATNVNIRRIEDHVQTALEAYREAVELLCTIPGVGREMSACIVAEVGTDMSRFPTAGHLISWAGLCPRSDESAGKRRSTRIREGAPWLKTGLVQTAWAATRVKGTHLRAKFYRIKSRRGSGKAVIAVAASILGAVFHILKNRVPYKELGDQPRDQKSAERAVQALKRKIEGFGYEVELKAAA
jgi:transposase